MSLGSAANIAQAGLNAITAQTAVLSRNVANANTVGYTTKTANLATIVNGGVQIISVTNAQNQALFENVLDATAKSAAQSAVSSGLTQIEQTVNDTGGDQSPSALLSDFTNAMQTYQSSPSDSALAASAVAAASTLSNALNSATTTVQNVREQADATMSQSVDQINTLLQQFQTANTEITSGTAMGADVTDAIDTRNEILTQLSQQIGITTVAGPNNGMNVYTDSGVTLFQGSARAVTFDPTLGYTSGTSGNAVYVGGVPITGN